MTEGNGCTADTADVVLNSEEQCSREAKHDTVFIQLLQMLQKEHDRELASVRHELHQELKARQGQLLKKIDSGEQLRDIGLLNPPQLAIAPDVPTKPGQNGTELQSLARLRSNHMAKLSSTSQMDEESEHDEKQKQYHAYNELEMLKGWATKHSLKTASRMFHHEGDEMQPRWRKRMLAIVATRQFDIVTGCAIASNAALMGAQADYVARHISEEPYVYRLIDRAYTVFFVLELLFRLVTFGWSFFYRAGWGWNLFDLLIVASDSTQTIIEITVGNEDLAIGDLINLRMLRILRLTRAFRMIRLIQFFRELRMMVYSMLRSGTAMLWSIFFTISIIFIFSIFLLSGVSNYIIVNGRDVYFENYRQYWDSLPQAMWTLFSCMTGGVSWMEVGDPLVHIGWMYGGALGFFMFFCIFVVTNIITGIFVDTAMQSSQTDRDEVIREHLDSLEGSRKQLKNAFLEADRDRSGTLTLDEFEDHLHNETVKAHFNSLGLHINEARGLFRLLDMDRSNEIGIEEFLFGCMRLKGTASSVDLATLMYENKRMMDWFKKFQVDVITLLADVTDKCNQIEIDVHKISVDRMRQATSSESTLPPHSCSYMKIPSSGLPVREYDVGERDLAP